MFAVVRHPDIETPGIVPEAALEAHQARGWYRVSDWRDEPAAFHLPDFDADAPDLDAPPEDEEPKKATRKRKTTEPQPDDEPDETTEENSE